MNLTIKLGDQMVDMPMDFSYPQWMRLRSLGDNVDNVSLISVCSGLDASLIKKAKVKQIEEISEVLTRFYFSGKGTSEIVLTFTHHGVEYGLQTDFSKLSFGAWVDLEVYSSEDIEKNIPKILSLMYYPIKKWKGKKYLLEEYSDELCAETAEAFEDIPIKIWWGFSTFFLLFVEKYTENIQNSMNTKMKINRWYQMGKKSLPKWLQRKLPQDSIFDVSKF